MKESFITITGIQHYYGTKIFIIGTIIKLAKEPGNPHDSESICAELPHIGKIGHVANSTHTVVSGTMSAGRLYDYFKNSCFAEVMFVIGNSVIAKVLNEGVTITLEKFDVKMDKVIDKNKDIRDIFADSK